MLTRSGATATARDQPPEGEHGGRPRRGDDLPERADVECPLQPEGGVARTENAVIGVGVPAGMVVRGEVEPALKLVAKTPRPSGSG